MSKDVLIVDDEAAIREVVGAVLEDEGYRPRGAANSDEALREIDRRPPGLVLLDIWLEGSALDGVQILERIKSGDADMPVIMFSGHGTIETAVAAIKKGAYDFIEKPFKSDRLLLAIQRALEASQLRREVRGAPQSGFRRDRADRQRAGDDPCAAGDRARGADGLAHHDQRPARFRQGGGGAADPRQVAPGRRAVRHPQRRGRWRRNGSTSSCSAPSRAGWVRTSRG